MDKKGGGGLTIKTIQLFVEVIIKSTQLISRRREMIHNGKSKQQIIDEK